MAHPKEWFSDWFDSPYYHILYKNRDMQEAEFFLQNLVNKLKLAPGQKLIDLACGKGRHSIFLSKLGFDVTGVDLSAQSIAAAKTFENDHLHFEVQDIRKLPYRGSFDVALNLFTSFGYFDCDDTNQLVVNQVYDALKPGGLCVIDFMNVNYVLPLLKKEEQKTIDGITFTIHKKVENDMIVKEIMFSDQGNDFHFHEEVQVLKREDFERWFRVSGFTLESTWGSYQLEPYHPETSERLILVARKHA